MSDDYRKTKIGFIPKDWELVTLEDIGGTYGGLKNKTKEDFGTGKPYIPFLNILNNPKIDINSFDYVDVHENEEQNRIKKGDIILFHTGTDKFFHTKRWRETPYLASSAADWLVSEFRPKIIGSDAWDIEDPNYDTQPVHTLLFKNNIAMVESATNLAAIGNDRVNIFILPLPIKGIDACPVRIIAFRNSNRFLNNIIKKS